MKVSRLLTATTLTISTLVVIGMTVIGWILWQPSSTDLSSDPTTTLSSPAKQDSDITPEAIDVNTLQASLNALQADDHGSQLRLLHQLQTYVEQQQAHQKNKLIAQKQTIWIRLWNKPTRP